MQKSRAIIIVHGSPASGKTTFSNHLFNISPYKTLLINVDDIQLFFHTHTVLQIPNAIQKSCRLQIQAKRTNVIFSPDIWKKSRDFIKNQLGSLVQICEILIIQDDFLLKSQRKPFKQYSALHKIHYLQIYMDTTLEQCLSLNQKRETKIPSQVLIQKYTKMQPSGCRLTTKQRNITWEWIEQHLQIPTIQLQVTDKPPQEQSIIEQTQLQIRRYISQIITTQLNITLFRKLSIKEIGKLLSSLKKSFDLKRGFEEFKEEVNKQSKKYV